MIDFKNIEGLYFVGIGGIGMSALASYFKGNGYSIAGYDRSESSITDRLKKEGCTVTFIDKVNELPSLFTNKGNQNRVLVVYTPAIPAENLILSFFKVNGYKIYKRSEVLGELSNKTNTIAIAGTHGKTTVSTMTAHILKQSHVDCSAFLGGISKNYDSNLVTGNSEFTIMEADEYDRSFHRLTPLIALITAVDPDHLEIYGDQKTMINSYNEFCKNIRPGGTLFINKKISREISCPENVTCNTYGNDSNADFSYSDIRHVEDSYIFNFNKPGGVIKDLHFPFPGIINIENLTAAIAIALKCGVTENEIREAIKSFKGVKRRFDICINKPGLAYIDDYAHHPEEIKACIMSLREYFKGRRITGIFQPHLFTRTRDHAAGFAEILDKLDEVILLPVYPAREKPLPGVSSEMIYDKMKLNNKRLLQMEDIPGKLDVSKLDVLVTIGAGNIDTLAEPIEKKLKRERVK